MNINFIWIKNLTVIKKIFLIISFFLFLFGLIFLFNQKYSFGFLFLFLFTCIFIFFKKWKTLFFMVIIFGLFFLLSKKVYFEYFGYEDNIKIFLLNKMESTKDFVIKEHEIELIKEYHSIKSQLDKTNYQIDDINLTFTGQSMNYLFFNVNIKNICFNLRTRAKLEKKEYFRFYISEQYDCNTK